MTDFVDLFEDDGDLKAHLFSLVDVPVPQTYQGNDPPDSGEYVKTVEIALDLKQRDYTLTCPCGNVQTFGTYTDRPQEFLVKWKCACGAVMELKIQEA